MDEGMQRTSSSCLHMHSPCGAAAANGDVSALMWERSELLLAETLQGWWKCSLAVLGDRLLILQTGFTHFTNNGDSESYTRFSDKLYDCTHKTSEKYIFFV